MNPGLSGWIPYDSIEINNFNRMKSFSYKNSREEQKVKTRLWDAFVSHLEMTYFPGASEVIDNQTIAFEYESFKDCYSSVQYFFPKMNG